MIVDRLVDHVKSTVGRIDSGWRAEESTDGIVVVRIRHQPYEHASTYVTLGLSRHVLPLSAEREVRQEFLCATADRFDSAHVASFLQTLAEYVAGEHKALARGQVIGPSEPVIPGTQLNAIYTAIPVLHDERLRTFEGPPPPTVFPWILPIHEEEASYVRQHGWEKFEERLEAVDPDLCDLARESIV